MVRIGGGFYYKSGHTHTHSLPDTRAPTTTKTPGPCFTERFVGIKLKSEGDRDTETRPSFRTKM